MTRICTRCTDVERAGRTIVKAECIECGRETCQHYLRFTLPPLCGSCITRRNNLKRS